MVSVQIYDTDQYLETLDGDITYIKTAGDLGELTHLNSSYSWTIKFPKTPNNTQILDGLGMVGSGSRKPYEKIYVNLLDNGYPIVVKGLLNIRNTGDDYKIYIQEGIIDFIKDLRNGTLGEDLDLSELDHERDYPTIISTLDLSKNYAYLIADVNGAYFQNENDTTNLNSEYMSPYANIKYIFDRIFQTYDWTYEMDNITQNSIAETWMSYPSDITLDNTFLEEVADISASNIEGYRFNSIREQTQIFKIPLTGTFNTTFIEEYGHNNIDFKVKDNGTYQIAYDVNAVARKYDFFAYKGTVSYKTAFFINNEIYFSSTDPFGVFQVPLYEGNIVSLVIFIEGITDSVSRAAYVITEIYDANLNIQNITYNGEVSFTQALIKLKISDFVKEVMTRESLTAFVDSEKRNIKFITLLERTSSEHVDWTKKYIKRTNESYLYQDYAQSNWLRHKYDDDISEYYDGNLPIDNANLEEEKTIYQSFTHAPINELSPFIDNGTNYKVPRLKMFEVEVKRDKDTDDLIGTYKFLKDRFFFVKTNVVDKDIYIDYNLVSGYPMVNLNGVLFKDIVNNNYNTFISISADAKVHDIELALSLSDIHSLDLSKLYYFEQEAAYYILNRLTYKTEKTTTGNFLKVVPNQKLNAFSNAFSNAFNI